MLRKASLPAQQPYRAAFPVSHDYDLWARLLRRGQGCNLSRVLVRYRRHGHQVTATRGELQERCARVVVEDELQRFGIDHTPRELDVHRAIGTRRVLLETDFFAEAADWLQRMSDHNRQVRHFAQHTFDQVLGELWFFINYVVAGHQGSSAWQRWRASSWYHHGRRAVPVSWQARLAVKALLKLTRD